jgi:hypothetical protein
MVGEVEQRLHDGGRPAAAAATIAAASAETAASAEFGGLKLVNYIQVDPLNGLLGDQQHGNEQKKHCNEK